MKIYLTMIAMALLVAGCQSASTTAASHYPPSPHYGGAPCPSSATGSEGIHPSPNDCIPGGID